MITSPHNDQLKTIRRLQGRRHRARTGLFAAEGEDLVAAAAAAGWAPELVLRAGTDVEPDLLASVSALGSGARVIGVYRQRFARPGGGVSVYLEGVADPGNVGAILRSAHALADGPVLLGPGCADPYGPKAVRASMGSVFARPPGRIGALAELEGRRVALVPREGSELGSLDLDPPVILCLGGERDGLSDGALEAATDTAHIPLRADGSESLNVAMAAAIALYVAGDRASRMTADA